MVQRKNLDLSIEIPGEECSNEWLEEVSDKDYLQLEK